jgi:hypothetical protein
MSGVPTSASGSVVSDIFRPRRVLTFWIRHCAVTPHHSTKGTARPQHRLPTLSTPVCPVVQVVLGTSHLPDVEFGLSRPFLTRPQYRLPMLSTAVCPIVQVVLGTSRLPRCEIRSIAPLSRAHSTPTPYAFHGGFAPSTTTPLIATTRHHKQQSRPHQKRRQLPRVRPRWPRFHQQQHPQRFDTISHTTLAASTTAL